MADPEQIVNDFSGHVRGLLTRAEELATQIVRHAEADATVIRERAEADAARIRAPAEESARRAEEGARGLLAAFRNSLDELEATLGWDREQPGDTRAEPPSAPPAAEATRRLVIEPEREPPLIREPTPDPAPDQISSPAPVSEPSPEPPQPFGQPPQPPEQPPPPAVEERDDTLAQAAEEAIPEAPPRPVDPKDTEAARLVAMKLALEGMSREDAKAELLASFDIVDLDDLIDEVYAQSTHVTRVRRWVPGLRRTR